jgi:CheY-like chemotaxis protein
VEDQREVRRLTAAVLQRLGYRTIEAADGEEALQIVQAHPNPIHLLLTDLVMPGMSGRELAARLRLARPDTRAIFMSGYAGGEAPGAGGLLDEASAFLQKPFSAEELAAKVRKALGETAAEASLLVVDDDPGIRKLFRAILAGAGYRVQDVEDGAQALAAMEERAFDMVITDLVMPEQEGIETIRQIRRRYPEVKIVAMSGAFGWEFLKIASFLGAGATLLKPVSESVLLSTVRRLLSGT